MEDQPEGRLAGLQPGLLREQFIGQPGLVDRQAGLGREDLQQLPMDLTGPSLVLGQVDREHADQLTFRRVQRREQRVQRVPGVGVRGDGHVRHPPDHLAFGQPLVRHEPQSAPAVRDLELGVEDVRGADRAEQRLARLRRSGDRDHLELAVGLAQVQHGDAEADAVHHSVDDGLQGLGQASPCTHPGAHLIETAYCRHPHSGLVLHVCHSGVTA